MRLTINWLNEFLEPKINEKELLELLTKKGISIVNYYDYLKDFSGFKIATIIEKEKEKTILKLANEKFITTENISAVVGQKIGYHPEQKKVLKGSDLNFPYEDCLIFDEFAEGEEVFSCLDNLYLEVEITPNRADLFSVFGLAREVTFFTERNLILPKLENQLEIDEKNELEIIVEDQAKCPIYIATKIINLKVKPSPLFYQWRLFLSGLRPINNIVDGSNYTLIQFGQPTHPFDLKRIFGNKIYIRQGKRGEKLKTIDGVERELSEKVLCISDSKRVIAIAGVIGGRNTEIIENTQEVLLESAFFSCEAIRESINFLKLRTEAARRFELGIDYENLKFFANYAANLIAQWGEGKIVKERKIVSKEIKKELIALPLNYPRRILGITFKREYIINILKRLGGEIINVNEREIVYQPPSWRYDLKLPIDLVEEIARYYGYENFASPFCLRLKTIGELKPFTIFLNRLRNFLVSRGLFEIITLSFLPESTNEGIRLVNPLNERLALLRDNLIHSFLNVIAYNFSFNNKDLRIFEIGKVYRKEKYVLAIALTGNNQPINFDVKPQKVDYFDLKGIVEELFTFLNISEINYHQKAFPYFSPFTSTTIICQNKELGWLGKVKEDFLSLYKIEGEVFYCQLALEEIYHCLPKEKIYQPLPLLLPVYRDLAFLINEEIYVQDIVNFIKKSFAPFIKEITIFDSFSGKPLPEGKRNLGIRLAFQPKDSPYTKEEIEELLLKIIKAVEKNFSAELRKK